MYLKYQNVITVRDFEIWFLHNSFSTCFTTSYFIFIFKPVLNSLLFKMQFDKYYILT